MGIYANDVQKLYIAYFNRPADPVGLAYWEEQITKNGGSTAAVANAFSASAEYKSLFAGKTSAQIVETIYNNLFGRSAEPSGLTYWAVRLENGTFNVGNIATSILVGAQNDDKKVVDNKVVVATEFTAALDTTAEILAYAGDAAAASARTFLATVGSTDASLTTAKAAVASTITAIANTTVANGTSFTLTTAADVLTGTAGNDTFNGFIDATANAPQTLTAADSIVGGAGTDVLNITVSGTAAALPGAAISGVETINVRAAGAALNSSDLSVFSGLTALNVDRSTAAVTVTNLAKGGSFGVIGDGSAQSTATYALGYANAADVATLNISGGVKGTTSTNGPAITLSGAGVTSTVINTTGSAANVTGAITALGTSVTVNAASNLTGTLTAAAATKLTATGTATVDFSGAALANNIVTVDASAMTAGGLKVAAGTSTAFKFTGGAGNDQVTTGATLTTGLVDAGAGTADRLVVGTSAHIDATAGKLYKGFEQLQVNATAAATTVDLDHLATTNTIDAVRINQNGAFNATVSNLSTAAAGNVTIVNAAPGTPGTDIITIGVKGATTAGQIDTVKAALTTTTAAGAAQAIDLTGLTLTGVEKLELTGNGTASTTTGAVTFTTTNATSLDSIKFANAANGNSITIAAGQATNMVVDASASTGGVTINATANNATTGVNLKGGASFDALYGASALSDVLVGGAGNDVFVGGALGGSTITLGTASAIGSATAGFAALTAGDTMTGGDGRDMFILGTNSALTTMSSITDLNLGGATAALGVDGITLDLATAGAATIVVLTDTQKANIAAAASLAAAFDVAAAADTTVNAVVQFTYGSDAYLFVNGVALGGTYSATNDVAIKITGVTGTLDASDITIV
ncbi:DUF4214 domain-containing protein [Noviherbaspirillum sp. ST9]|uniref:DUF4214 domain-containing protein n=1 Tax=Noviherbaspirillum sp. ST9 TaxID=3401606 RepID=UPI003B589664